MGKRMRLVAGALLILALLVLAGGGAVLAQGPGALQGMPCGRGLGLPGGMGMLPWGPGADGTREAIADVLGMTPEELMERLRAGDTLADLGEEAGVTLEEIQSAVQAARAEAQGAAIEAAVDEGDLSPEQADWLLKGLDSGYSARLLHGLGGPARGAGAEAQEAIADALGLTVDELRIQLWGGRTLAELADAAGLELQELYDAATAAQALAQRDQIAQAVEDGAITQEQADWLLEGLENGYLEGGAFSGGGLGFGGMMGGMGHTRGMMRGMGRGVMQGMGRGMMRGSDRVQAWGALDLPDA